VLHSTFKPSVLETFRSAFYGTLIVPGDANYEGARRVWNGMIDKHPSLIVRCANSADVISAVKFAREQELAVSVRGGGYSAAGKALCDRGLVIDLSAMKGIQVDPIKRTARAEVGLTLGDFISATRDYGLATNTGVV
jgi:FAD/FMN-containing dehydrogenase